MNKIALLAIAATLALTACGKDEQKSSEAAAPPPAPAAATEPAASAPAAAPAFVTNDPKLQHGYEVFQKWCTPCHAPGPGHPGTQALEAKYRGSTPAPLEDRTDLTQELTKFYVRNGVSIMPPFRKTEVTDADLDALAAYLARPH